VDEELPKLETEESEVRDGDCVRPRPVDRDEVVTGAGWWEKYDTDCGLPDIREVGLAGGDSRFGFVR